MKKKTLPKISVIIPTYNSEADIGKCLRSIFRQKYPQNLLEVIVVDDSSQDNTLDIVKQFPVKVAKHKSRHGEIGKMIGFREASGEYAVYLDSDCELKGSNWFQKMAKPLIVDSDIIGSFTRYYAKTSAPAVERYLCFDPLQRDSLYQLFSPSIKDTIVEKKKSYQVCRYTKEKIAPAGLCLYRREKLLPLVNKYKMFLELDFLVILVRNGFNKFAYVPEAGLYHHQASSVRELLKKRRYNTKKVYLATIDRRLYKWFDLRKIEDIGKILFWIVYSHLLFPSVLVGFYKSIKFKDWAGLYEPVINLLVTDVILLSFFSDQRSFKLVGK